MNYDLLQRVEDTNGGGMGWRPPADRMLRAKAMECVTLIGVCVPVEGGQGGRGGQRGEVHTEGAVRCWWDWSSVELFGVAKLSIRGEQMMYLGFF